MREKGLEPPRLGHQILSLARLPIPPFPQSPTKFGHKKRVGKGIRTLGLQSHNLAP